MNKLKLGILEFGNINSEFSSIGKISDILDLTVEADRLGFSKYWFSEHHNYINDDPWSNPLVLLPIVLNNTENINVGLAGILLNFYSSYETAMHFKLLSNLFPDRVDLGIANGNPPIKIKKMLTDNELYSLDRENTIPRKINEFYEMFHNEHSFSESNKVVIPPYQGEIPNVYFLSSSFDNIDTAIKYKFHFSMSIFHSAKEYDNTKQLILQKREEYFDKNGFYPNINVAFTGACAETSIKAENIAKNSKIDLVNAIVGTPQYFQERLLEMKEYFGVNEFIFRDVALEYEDRLNTLSLLSDIFQLKKQP
ncbi:LLM class flavin-dependent oxidoreductase [Chryseobacterium sp. NRRL B-14859]|uniref:LLM class flavin-dependent oxidoreductase n=1 Tax=Chryseobacterium sp. NRRL B-14859 TaxID=1562763 RepID=UPI003396E463